MKKYLSLIFALLALTACQPAVEQESGKSEIEMELERLGLQCVSEEIPTVEVYMVYATPYNFMGRVLYEGLDKAYLVPEAMAKLKRADELLRKKRLDLHLVVYDAARPRSIQQQMWSMVENTDMQNFVANPNRRGGGPHNYGMAVDVTLVDCTGHPLPMGSEYDYFGDRARVDIEAELLASGEITYRELQNRLLLREIMTEAGWLVISSEWWHFNAMPLKEASQRLTVIE